MFFLQEITSRLRDRLMLTVNTESNFIFHFHPVGLKKKVNDILKCFHKHSCLKSQCCEYGLLHKGSSLSGKNYQPFDYWCLEI